MAKRKVRVEQNCDLLLKGGITSGVIYPLAVCELARTYRFRNIGGTSTGAIAAAFTAAAEHGRREGTGGFAALAGLPAWFGERSLDGRRNNLLALFQPQRETRRAFNLALTAVRGRQGTARKCGGVLSTALWNFPLSALLGAAPGVTLIALAWREAAGWLGAWGLVSGLLLAMLGLVATVGVAFARVAIGATAKNYYGLCTGFAAPRDGAPKPLTAWFTDFIDQLAGRDPATDPPLTFGDLWGTDDDEAPRRVNLQMLTTSLTHGRPFRLPFEGEDDGVFYFDPGEFRRFFPARVVDWLVAKADPGRDAHAPLVALPPARDLPVAVAVRLSLSFPVLVSAVPLYAVDESRETKGRTRPPERCWFSDGGLASNLPLHFFDQPLPRWPTFAVNLRPFHPDRPAQEVWMPKSDQQHGIASWVRFEGEDGRPNLFGFFGAIKAVTQNWMDNDQLRVPGYRDRVVHVSLHPQEGGFNLDMPENIVAALSGRGRLAAKALVRRFAAPSGAGVATGRDKHRWVRYRSTMYLVETLLKKIAAGYGDVPASGQSYGKLARRGRDAPPPGYPWWNAAQRRFGVDATETLVSLVNGWKAPHQTFAEADPDDPGPPQPTPELRIVPRV